MLKLFVFCHIVSSIVKISLNDWYSCDVANTVRSVF